VAQQIHRLDPSFLCLEHAQHHAQLRRAGGADRPRPPTTKPEHIDAIPQLARRQYDFVVLDVGRSLDAVSIRALDHADMIFPVLQTTLPYIRDSKRLLNVFRSLEYGRKDPADRQPPRQEQRESA
jgi:pilus assembly protein CpaE